MDLKHCLNCSNIFGPSRPSGVYCCRSCQVGHLRRSGKIKDKPRQGVICKCLHCDQEFYVPQYRALSAKYCSRRCSILNKPEIGEKARNNSPLMKRSRALKQQGQSQRQYKMLYINGKQVREHRWIMEQHLGRQLERWEHVHHIDGDHLNNTLENLEVLSNADHQRKELAQWKDD